MATLRENPGLKVTLLVAPTCKIPRSTQKKLFGNKAITKDVPSILIPSGKSEYIETSEQVRCTLLETNIANHEFSGASCKFQGG